MVDTQHGTALWPNGPTLESLRQEIAEGWITERWHASLPLRILNYNQKTQYERHWTPETLACRGLILDADGTVVQRPFAKFFNLGEGDITLPVEPFDVYEKMDGSLGILYWDGDAPAIATRGSFHSVQASLATNILRARCDGDYSLFDRSLTYLFEIIHPQNRIVVDYGDREDLVLLAIIDTATGQDLPLPESFPFPLIERFDGIEDINALLDEDRETTRATWSGSRAGCA